MRFEYRGATITTSVRGSTFGADIRTPETSWSIKETYGDMQDAAEAAKSAVNGFIELNKGKTVCR
jgi:hypothetical protein